MQEFELKQKMLTRILTNPEKILQHLHKGISIPILPEFRKYILGDLENYNAEAIVLEKEMDEDYFGERTDKIVGITLIYGDGSDTLFFGFFGAYDHDPNKIKVLVNSLIEYGKINGFKRIRGPINVPTCIFGWGFMVEGSKKDLFIGSPINPPIYQGIFLKKGFEALFQEDRYEMPALKMNPHKDKKLINLGINAGDYKNNPFDTGDYEYEYVNPGKEGMIEVKDEFVELYEMFMPPSAQITPKTAHNVDNLINFVFEFGADWMMWIVRHKPTGKMVANGYVIPDVFSKDKKGELNSISFHAWVVHPENRRKYIAMLMYGMTSLKGKDRKTPHYITRGSWPVGAENLPNGNAAKKMGGKKDRSHLILELKL
ncbi:MAG: hypothetical protein ACFFAN_04040 [Promethearchaeota archaeon]